MLLKRKDPITKSYDCIIIGSGMAGLTAANRLGKLGHNVLLLEAHNKLGGLATWFKRPGGHIFDVSLHGFPIGMKKTCRKYWNKKISQLIVKLEDIRFINPQFNLKTTFEKEDYTNILVDQFNLEREKVIAFYDYLASMNFYDKSETTNKELFEKFFPGRNDVVRFLMEPITYANGSDLNDPAISYGIVFSNFMSHGVYTFKGGTDYLISLMKEELLCNNVDIKMLSKVDKISISDNKVRGVILDGQFIKSKTIISNAGIKSTIFNLCGKENFKPDYIQKAQAVRLNSSSAQVYIGIKEGETIEHVGDLIFTSTHPNYEFDQVLSKNITSRTFSIYYPQSRPELKGRYTIVCSTNHNFQDFSQMSEEQYKDYKNKMIDDTLNELEKIIPGVKEKIDYIDAATPKTVQRYTLSEEGSSFGTKFEGLEVSNDLPSQIHGLYHSGSVGIIMSGWLGAANYGAIIASAVDRQLDSFKLGREKRDGAKENYV